MKFSSSCLATLCFLSVIMAVISCGNNNNPPAESVIYYYPQKNIYYDSLQSNYYYSLDSARSWDSMVFRGAGYGVVLGPKVPIERTEDIIWANNASHRKQYNGVLLNIVNNQTILISKEDSIHKVKANAIAKKRVEVVEEEEPPQKGLKKFFNNLFGKKKKPAKEKTQ